MFTLMLLVCTLGMAFVASKTKYPLHWLTAGFMLGKLVTFSWLISTLTWIVIICAIAYVMFRDGVSKIRPF